MKKGPFIEAVAAGTLIERKTVQIFVRELINAGMLSSGGRGINAPHMTAKDLATILTAMLGTEKPARAVAAVEYFGGMQPSLPEAWASGGTLPESPDHTFLELMTCFCDPGVDLPLGIIIERTGNAHIFVTNQDVDSEDGVGAVVGYRSRELMDRAMQGDVSDLLILQGLVRSAQINSVTIQALKEMVFADVENDPQARRGA